MFWFTYSYLLTVPSCTTCFEAKRDLSFLLRDLNRRISQRRRYCSSSSLSNHCSLVFFFFSFNFVGIPWLDLQRFHSRFSNFPQISGIWVDRLLVFSLIATATMVNCNRFCIWICFSSSLMAISFLLGVFEFQKLWTRSSFFFPAN